MATKPKVVNDIQQAEADRQISDFLGEPVKDGNVVIETNPVEVKAEAAPADEAVVETPAKPEVDLEAFKKEVLIEASEEVKKYLEGKDMEETKDKVDDYTKYAKEVWDKEGRNPTYEEALEFVTGKAVEKLKSDQETEIKTKAEQEEARVKAETEANQKQEQAFSALVDEEMDELYSKNRLPKIVDKNNEKDEGVIARKALFQKMLEVNQERAKENKPLIYSVSRIFHEYYEAPKDVAGADAPVSSGTSPNTGGDGKPYTYGSLKKASFLDILMGK